MSKFNQSRGIAINKIDPDRLEGKNTISMYDNQIGPLSIRKINTDENGKVIDMYSDEDFMLCVRYVTEVELNRNGKVADIAKQLNMTKTQMTTRVGHWRKTGLLQRVRRELFQTVYSEMVDIPIQQALSAWPEIMANQIETSLSKTSRRNALDAAKWIHEKFIEPAQKEGVVESMEGEYIKTLGDSYNFDPMSIIDADFEEIPEEDEEAE